MPKFGLLKACPMCGYESKLFVDTDKYYHYMHSKELIQDVFPELNPAQREFIKTGYCSECQHLLFGSRYNIESEVK